MRELQDGDFSKFNPYEFLARVAGTEVGEEIMLSDQFSASEYALMIKTALRAVELLAHRVAELEAAKAAPSGE